MANLREQEGQQPPSTMTIQLVTPFLPKNKLLVVILKHSFLNYFDQNVWQTYKSRRYLVENQCISQLGGQKFSRACLFSVTVWAPSQAGCPSSNFALHPPLDRFEPNAVRFFKTNERNKAMRHKGGNELKIYLNIAESITHLP